MKKGGNMKNKLNKLILLFCALILIILPSCKVRESDKELLINLSDEMIEASEAKAKESLKEWKNEKDCYTKNGKILYNTETYEPCGMIFDVKSEANPDYEGFILVGFLNYKNPKSIYVDHIDSVGASPYKYVPDDMILYYNGEYLGYYYNMYLNSELYWAYDLYSYEERAEVLGYYENNNK